MSCQEYYELIGCRSFANLAVHAVTTPPPAKDPPKSTKSTRSDKSRLAVLLKEQDWFSIYKRFAAISFLTNVVLFSVAVSGHWPCARDNAALLSLANVVVLSLCRNEVTPADHFVLCPASSCECMPTAWSMTPYRPLASPANAPTKQQRAGLRMYAVPVFKYRRASQPWIDVTLATTLAGLSADGVLADGATVRALLGSAQAQTVDYPRPPELGRHPRRVRRRFPSVGSVCSGVARWAHPPSSQILGRHPVGGVRPASHLLPCGMPLGQVSTTCTPHERIAVARAPRGRQGGWLPHSNGDFKFCWVWVLDVSIQGNGVRCYHASSVV